MQTSHVTPEFLASQGLSPTFPKRFFDKVDKDGPVPEHMPHLGKCWVWTGSCLKSGYGRISSRYRGRLLLAHVASWILHSGSSPNELLTLHKCDHPPCVRPSHLFLGTKRDNTMDSIAKGRWAPQFGSHNGNSKLSEEQILEIRRGYLAGRTNPEMAIQYGVTRHCIWEVVRRMKWTHI